MLCYIAGKLQSSASIGVSGLARRAQHSEESTRCDVSQGMWIAANIQLHIRDLRLIRHAVHVWIFSFFQFLSERRDLFLLGLDVGLPLWPKPSRQAPACKEHHAGNKLLFHIP